MSKLSKTFKITTAVLVLSSLVLSPIAMFNTARADVIMMGGNFFTVGNNTVPGGSIGDSVDASPMNIVEFFMRVRNEGDETAKRVQVFAELPSNVSTSLVTKAFIRPNNPDKTNVQVSDTATVNVLGGQPVALNLFPGHSRLSGVTNLFNCPNTCDIPDSIPNGGMEIGDIPAGGEVQVAFKAILTGTAPTPTVTVVPTATPTPTVSPTATPTITATPTPTPPQGGQQLQCPEGHQFVKVEGNNIICIQNQNVNNNSNQQSQSQTQNNTQTQNVTVNNTNTAPAPAVAGVTTVSGVKVLPKTGLPILAWLALAFIPAGMKLKNSSKDELEENITPNYLWEERKFKTRV